MAIYDVTGRKVHPKFRKILLTIFSIGFLALGVLMLVSSTFSLMYNNSIQGWPTTNGVVLSSNVSLKMVQNGNGPYTTSFYSPNVIYSYSVSGKNYTGNRLVLEYISSGEASAELLVNKYPVGTNVIVHYDAHNPGSSVLQSDVGNIGFYVVIVFGLVFSAVGVLALKSSRKKVAPYSMGQQ